MSEQIHSCCPAFSETVQKSDDGLWQVTLHEHGGKNLQLISHCPFCGQELPRPIFKTILLQVPGFRRDASVGIELSVRCRFDRYDEIPEFGLDYELEDGERDIRQFVINVGVLKIGAIAEPSHHWCGTCRGSEIRAKAIHPSKVTSGIEVDGEWLR